MTPEQLKASILQLAIQGKLVEQRPEEGTAEELYRQIQAEKQRLIKEGKIKKDKPLPDIAEDEKPFDIPESWKWVRLLDLCKSITDGDHQPPPQVPSGVPFLVISNISSGKLDFSATRYVPQDYFEALSGDRVAEYGDLLFTVTGSYGIPLKVDCTEKFCFQRHIALLKLMIDLDYLYYLLMSPVIKSQCDAVATGIAQKTVGLTSLRNMVVPLPSLAEQKRIVAKIEKLLPLVDRYAVAYEKLEQFNAKFPENMKKSILQYAIQGKLVEQRAEEGTGEELYRQIQSEKQRLIKEGKIKKEKPLPEIAEDEKPYNIPDNWTWVRFGELGSYKKGPFGSAITKNMFVPKGNGAIKVYEQKNAIQKDAILGDYYIRKDYFESKMKGFEVFPGDIIVSCAGTIGETYVMPDEFEQGIINQALMRMKIFEPIHIPYFLIFFDFVLKNNARSSSKGSAIKNIPPFEILKKYLVPIPPLAEQKRIVAKLEEILPLCERLK